MKRILDMIDALPPRIADTRRATYWRIYKMLPFIGAIFCSIIVILKYLYLPLGMRISIAIVTFFICFFILFAIVVILMRSS